MIDTEFDAVVREAGRPVDVPASVLALLVNATRDAPSRRRRPRRPLVIGVAIAGSVLLAAAANTGGWMDHAPFMSLDANMYRTQHAIPIDYTTTGGFHTKCLGFLEFMNLTAAQSVTAETYVTDHDWSGIGQRVYDAAAATSTDTTTVRYRMNDELESEFRDAAFAALPDLAESANGTDKAAWSGMSYSCATGQN